MQRELNLSMYVYNQVHVGGKVTGTRTILVRARNCDSLVANATKN